MSSLKCTSRQLENIEEEGPARWLPMSLVLPRTPTESMEFLARSWSLSAMELSKVLSETQEKSSFSSDGAEPQFRSSLTSLQIPFQTLPSEDSPIISPRESEDLKEWFLFHQTVNPDFLYSKHLYKNGLLYKNKPTVKPNGRRSKHEKERKKQEIRIHNAQLKATVSVAGVAAAVAAISATSAKTTLSETSVIHNKSVAIASAAALVASHCIEIAEEMGADQDQILTVVDSAINARTSGDIMTLTAGAATALRGAATLRATLQKGYGSVQGNSVETSTALNFVFVGGELLKRTRKGALHWKQVSFYRNSNGQVVAKMKSKHMGGAFTKKKKCVILEVYCDIPAWPGREREGGNERRDYFGIKTIDRIIEFQCRGKGDKLMWTQGIQHMLNSRATMTWC